MLPLTVDIGEDDEPAKILKAIPRELRLISLDYALGRATFTKDEVIWFYSQIQGNITFSIFYGCGKEAILFKYIRSRSRPNGFVKHSWKQLKHYPSLQYRGGESSSHNEEAMPYNKLIGRLDTKTVRIQSNEMMDNPGQLQANVVLTDINSTMKILCRRYELEKRPNSKQLGIGATKHVLHNIAEYHGLFSSDNEKLPALLIFLDTSTETFEASELNLVSDLLNLYSGNLKGREREICLSLYNSIQTKLDSMM